MWRRIPALWCTCIALGAQTTTRSATVLAADLSSTEAPVVIAAAAEAARGDDRMLQAPLCTALRTWSGTKEPLATMVRLFVLDALAQLRSKLPATDLLPLLDEELVGDIAFCLLLREPLQNETELFACFQALWHPPEPGANTRQIAAHARNQVRAQALGNLLARQRPPGFVALICADQTFDLHLEVHSPGDPEIRGSVARAGSVRNSKSLPDGLPPIPIYTWSRVAPGETPRGELLAPGAIGVQVERGLLENRRLTSNIRRYENPPDPRIWLETAVGGAMERPPEPVLVFQDAASFRRELAAAKATHTAWRTGLLQRLVANKALTTEDAARLGGQPLVVHCDDRRQDRKVPLPPVDDLR